MLHNSVPPFLFLGETNSAVQDLTLDDVTAKLPPHTKHIWMFLFLIPVQCETGARTICVQDAPGFLAIL